jgi:hypothetical protein
MKKVFVVVLHYKGKEFTRQCLLSLEKLKMVGFSAKIVVVDNHSPEPIDEFKKEFKKVTFLKNGQNLGFAEGNNVGIRQALKKKADYVLILNNDTTVDRNLLSELLRAAEKDRKIGIVAPKIYFAPGYEYHKARYKPSEQGKVFWYAGGAIDWQNVLCSHRGVDEVNKRQYDKQTNTDYASGCALLVKRQIFEKIGLFDKRYFLYLEDVEFCQRAKKVGFKVVYVPKALLWHFNAGSSEVGGPLHDYFLTRNRMLFGLKYASWRAKFNLAKESIKLLITGREWQKTAIRDFYQRKLGKGSWHD